MNTKNRNIVAWSVSIGIHVVLLLLFILIKYTLPAQSHAQEEYLEIALGTDDDGMGNDPAEWMDDPAAPSAQQQLSHSSAADEHDMQPDELATHDVVKVNKTVKRDNTPVRNNNQPNNERRNNQQTSQQRNATTNTTTTASNTRNPRLFHADGPGTGGNSADRDNPGTGRGTGNTPGQFGSPGGSVNGTIKADARFKNRKLERYSNSAAYRESGRVEAIVYINKNGDVVDHSILSATNSTLQSIAVQKIKSMKFTKSETAPERQSGKVIINFPGNSK